MPRSLLLCVSAALLYLNAGLATAQVSGARLIDQAAAARHGLTRDWFVFVSVGGGRSPIVDMKFDGGQLFVQTGMATTHAIDGATGRTLWVAEVGSPRHTSAPLGVGESRVAVINGTTLYILDRSTGQVQFSKKLRGVSEVGAAITEEVVFVPNTMGQIETYSLNDDEHQNVANLRLEGRDLTQPAVSHHGVAIGSGHGDVGLASLSGTELIFRFPTNFACAASPAAWGPRVFAGNDGGILYAFDDVSGTEKWSFAAGSAITQSPVPFADAVYVLCEDLTLYRVSTETGREGWMAKDVRRFLATSGTNVYTIDRFGRLAILSAKTGALIDRASIPAFAFPITNRYTDQILLATDTGFIQSLREIGRPERMDYRPPKKEPPKQEPAPAVKAKAKEVQPPTPATPPPPQDAPAPLPKPTADDPFGPADAKPAETVDPFGAR